MQPQTTQKGTNGKRKKAAKVPTTSTPKACKDQLHKVLEKITGKELNGCDLCVELMSRLKAHILSHNPEKVPVDRKDEVMNHGKEKEVNAKLHRCVLCKQSFTQASDLSKHILHHVRQKEQGKHEKVFKAMSSQSPANKVKSGRILDLSSIMTSTSASLTSVQGQSNQNNLNQLKDIKTRISYIIRTRRSIVRTRRSSRLALDDQNQNETRFETQGSVLVDETEVKSDTSSKSSTERVPDSNLMEKSVSKTPSEIGDQNAIPSHPSAATWNRGSISENINPLEPSATSLAATNAVQHSTSSILAPETLIKIYTFSASPQIIPETFINDEARSLSENSVPSSNTWASGSDLIYATIMMPTPPRKLWLRFPRKALKPRNRQISPRATVPKKSLEDPLEMLSQEN